MKQHKGFSALILQDTSRPSAAWPFPRWIAHRGAGLLAPENTLAAFKLGAEHGYRMAECDVKLSADGIPFLLHDATLDRTTDGHGLAGHLPWAQLAVLDAGSWHSTRYRGEPVPTLETVARWCQSEGIWLNIEIKPSPGTDAQTGREVALATSRLWANHPQKPLLTSFHTAALAAACLTAPELPRGHLLDTFWPGWFEATESTGCEAIVCNHLLWTAETVAQAKSAGLRTLAFTVNDAPRVQRLLELGLDGLITDRVDLFRPS